MPATLAQALAFLETQWSSINENKVKGIEAEVRFKIYLNTIGAHAVPGGWIMVPGTPSVTAIPTAHKICLLPRAVPFSWGVGTPSTAVATPAEIAAYLYFRQVGIRAFFIRPDAINQSAFVTPVSSRNGGTALYPKPYTLTAFDVGPDGNLRSVPTPQVFAHFPRRNGNTGLRCYEPRRLDSTITPWNDPAVVTELFWFEYARYYYQTDYLISNSDLDLFLLGPSGTAYPVELKSKTPASDRALGDWFGIDMGPFAKLSLFTANAMNTDALYVVEEVDASRNHVEWFAIRFTELVRACSWVGQSGGQGMMGGQSTTFKVPRAAFHPLSQLFATL